jgi:hypothetical protein
LRHKWLKLPMAAMRDVGPAVQTLGSVLKVTLRETFVPVSRIASRAHLPTTTVRKHLKALHDAGWIVNRGRQRTRSGAPRRTCTIAVTPMTLGAAQTDYGLLPWWAAGNPELNWSARALLSVIMAKLAAVRAGAEKHLPNMGFWAAFEGYGWCDQFRFGLDVLGRNTGLARESIIAAKRTLARHGIINWLRGPKREDGGMTRDYLVPEQGFLVTITPTSPGVCASSWPIPPKKSRPLSSALL